MSWERSGHGGGPMKWIPSPPSSSQSGGGTIEPPMGSPTPSYTTAASTASATPTTPSSSASSSPHGGYAVWSSASPWGSSLSPSPLSSSSLRGTPQPCSPAGGQGAFPLPLPPGRHNPSCLDYPSLLPSPAPKMGNSQSVGREGCGCDRSPRTELGYEGDQDQEHTRSAVARRHRSGGSSYGQGESSPAGPCSELVDSELLTSRCRALELLERTVEERASLAVPPRGRKGKRQCASQLRALSLFDEQYGDACETGEDGKDGDGNSGNNHGESVNDLKSEIDKIRQRGAGMRALNLLNATAAGEMHKVDVATVTGGGISSSVPKDYKLLVRGGTTSWGGGAAIVAGCSGTGMTARRAAQISYEVRRKEKDEIKAKFRRDLEAYGRRVPKVAVPVRTEALAETTRKKKPTSEDDVRDPETVSGMKCQLHWDREKEARAKALQLLNDRSASLIAML